MHQASRLATYATEYKYSVFQKNMHAYMDRESQNKQEFTRLVNDLL